jgi:lactoylglutathione lyase
MRIEHIAYWTTDLERMKQFFVRYFRARAGAKYENPAKGFESYFLELESGARIELMRRRDLAARSPPDPVPRPGLAHLALALGSEAAVDALTAQLRDDGYAVVDGPRRTGEGYYESVVLDPDGNRLELTV